MIENLVRLLEESTSIENDDPYLISAIANKKLDISRILATLKDTARILGNVSKGEILVLYQIYTISSLIKRMKVIKNLKQKWLLLKHFGTKRKFYGKPTLKN